MLGPYCTEPEGMSLNGAYDSIARVQNSSQAFIEKVVKRDVRPEQRLGNRGQNWTRKLNT